MKVGTTTTAATSQGLPAAVDLVQKRDFVVDILYGVLQSPAPGPCLCFDIPHRGFSRLQVRGCGIDGRSFHSNRVLKRLLVELSENLAFVHAVIVIHQYPRDLAGDPRSDERHMAVNIGVVRRNGVEGCKYPGDAEYADGGQNKGAERADQ